MNVRNIIVISIIALIVIMPFLVIPSYASIPSIVQRVFLGKGAAQVGTISTGLNVMHTGDDVVVGVTGALRSGSDSGITVTGNASEVCTNAVINNANGAGAITIIVCPNLSSGTHNFLGQWTSGTCGVGGVPCGFMAMFIYEISGTGYTYTNSSGTNVNSNSGTALTSSVTVPAGTSVLLGFDSVNTASTTQTVGTGFVVTACFTSGVNSAQFACSENQNYTGSASSTTFPWTLSQSSAWSDEGIVITSPQIITTKTITGWVFPNFANGVNSFSWFIGFLILLIPLAMVDSVFMAGSLNIDRNVVIFINLAMLFLGALLATMVNQLPFAIPFVFGMFLVVYIWRGRG